MINPMGKKLNHNGDQRIYCKAGTKKQTGTTKKKE